MPQALELQTYTRCDICDAELDESVTAYHPPLCDPCDEKETVFFEQREAIRAQYLREGASNPYSLSDEGGDDDITEELLTDEDDDEETLTDDTELPDGFFAEGACDSEDAEA